MSAAAATAPPVAVSCQSTALSRYLKYVVAQLIVELWRWISVGALVFSGGSVERGNLTPDREALIYFGSPLGRAEPMPSWSKVPGDAAKGRQEPLGMPHRFKAFHRPFALSGGLMRVLGAIVQILRPTMLYRRHELAVRHLVAGQFVGHQHAVHTAGP